MRLLAGEPGIDPYTRTTSDVYQDLFQEGSFIGKGIYDVDAFEKTLRNRFPENQILSHDLLEGSYARAGLVSDVQLYEDVTPGISVRMRARRHRWVPRRLADSFVVTSQWCQDFDGKICAEFALRTIPLEDFR